MADNLVSRKFEEQAMLAESAPKQDELEWYREVMADLNPKSALAEGVKKGFKQGRKTGREEGRKESQDEARLEESKYFLTSIAEKKWGHPLGEPVNQVIRKCNNHGKIRQLVHQLDLINSEADLIKFLQTA